MADEFNPPVVLEAEGICNAIDVIDGKSDQLEGKRGRDRALGRLRTLKGIQPPGPGSDFKVNLGGTEQQLVPDGNAPSLVTYTNTVVPAQGNDTYSLTSGRFTIGDADTNYVAQMKGEVRVGDITAPEITFVPVFGGMEDTRLSETTASDEWSGGARGKHFTVFTATDSYNMWFNISGTPGATDPINDNYIEVDLTSAVTANDSAVTIDAALQANTVFTNNFSSALVGDVITITSNTAGKADYGKIDGRTNNGGITDINTSTPASNNVKTIVDFTFDYNVSFFNSGSGNVATELVITEPGDINTYTIWYNDGLVTAPTPGATVIEVDISSLFTAAQIKDATYAALLGNASYVADTDTIVDGGAINKITTTFTNFGTKDNADVKTPAVAPIDYSIVDSGSPSTPHIVDLTVSKPGTFFSTGEGNNSPSLTIPRPDGINNYQVFFSVDGSTGSATPPSIDIPVSISSSDSAVTIANKIHLAMNANATFASDYTTVLVGDTITYTSVINHVLTGSPIFNGNAIYPADAEFIQSGSAEAAGVYEVTGLAKAAYRDGTVSFQPGINADVLSEAIGHFVFQAENGELFIVWLKTNNTIVSPEPLPVSATNHRIEVTLTGPVESALSVVTKLQDAMLSAGLGTVFNLSNIEIEIGGDDEAWLQIIQNKAGGDVTNTNSGTIPFLWGKDGATAPAPNNYWQTTDQVIIGWADEVALQGPGGPAPAFVNIYQGPLAGVPNSSVDTISNTFSFDVTFDGVEAGTGPVNVTPGTVGVFVVFFINNLYGNSNLYLSGDTGKTCLSITKTPVVAP